MAAHAKGSGPPIGVTALWEDSQRRLWIGTQGDGLFCYADGIVTRFGGAHGPVDKTINSIAEDPAGNLWLGTPSGLDQLRGERVVKFTVKDGLPNDFVSSVHVARSGTVWITTRGGICQFKEGKLQLFPFQTDSPGRSPESLGVYEDRRGNLWAFGDTYLVNLTEGKHLNHFGSGDTTSSMRIWSLCEGRRGELWIGTSGKGLYCFAEEKFIPITLRDGSLTSDVRALCEDREGNLWLGTDGSGLARLQPRNFRLLNASMGLPKWPALCLALDPRGRTWIGFERGGVYEGAGEAFEPIAHRDAAVALNLVSSMCVTPDSNIWVATVGSGLFQLCNQRVVRYTTADGLPDDTVLSVGADSERSVWVGTLAGGVQRFREDGVVSYGAGAGLPVEPVRAILPARNGGVWLGFSRGQVFRERGAGFQAAVDSSVFGGQAITSLNEDSAGRLWMGTEGGWVGCLAGGHFAKWEVNQPPPTDPITGILTDDDGDLWLSTASLIRRVAKDDVARSLSGESSLRSETIFRWEPAPESAPRYGWPRAVKSAQGKLWFGMAGGVVTFDAHGIVSASPLPVLIEQVIVNGKPLAPGWAAAPAPRSNRQGSPFRLSSSLRSLEIEFTAVNLSAPEKIRFRYRLEGFEPDWVKGGADRTAHYGRLPYGAYNFRVQASMVDGPWPAKEASFAFMLPTPLWRREWALATYLLVALGLVAVTVRMIAHRRFRRRLAVLHAQQAMERERIRIAQDMHDEIGSKLTKISFMSELAKGELEGHQPVARKLVSIAHTSRELLQSLDEIVWAVNPRNDTLEHVAAYLGQYATEYLQNTPVECELHIPRTLPHHSVSAETRHNLFLAFEESLNNALKHGKASRVRVDMRVEASRFHIRVEDNGCGFEAGPSVSKAGPAKPSPGGHRGNGLLNMGQRLGEVGGECSIRSQPGAGTTVTLSVPLGAAVASLKES